MPGPRPALCRHGARRRRRARVRGDAPPARRPGRQAAADAGRVQGAGARAISSCCSSIRRRRSAPFPTCCRPTTDARRKGFAALARGAERTRRDRRRGGGTACSGLRGCSASRRTTAGWRRSCSNGRSTSKATRRRRRSAAYGWTTRKEVVHDGSFRDGDPVEPAHAKYDRLIARAKQVPAANDDRRASLRRDLAARRDRGGRGRPHRPDPGRAGRQGSAAVAREHDLDIGAFRNRRRGAQRSGGGQGRSS